MILEDRQLLWGRFCAIAGEQRFVQDAPSFVLYLAGGLGLDDSDIEVARVLEGDPVRECQQYVYELDPFHRNVGALLEVLSQALQQILAEGHQRSLEFY